MLKTGQPVRQRAAVHVLTTVVLVAGNTATAPALNHRAYAEEAENEIGNCGIGSDLRCFCISTSTFCEDN
jgi:hypothetical protein